MKQKQFWYELLPEVKIDDIGFVKNIRSLHPARKGVPYWILVLIDKGQRTLYANGEELRIGTHEFFLLPPNTAQLPIEEDVHTACFVHFYAEGKKIILPEHIKPGKLYLPMYGRLPDDIDCLSHLKYLHEHLLHPYADLDFVSEQLKAILAVMSLHCQKYPNQTEKKDVFHSTCLSFIKEHICISIRAQDYEHALGLSYRQINQNFKKAFGTTVKQYHRHLRMKYAAQLLQSGLSIQQVADETGYDDYYFFVKSFKKEYGVTPRTFQDLYGMSEDA